MDSLRRVGARQAAGTAELGRAASRERWHWADGDDRPGRQVTRRRRCARAGEGADRAELAGRVGWGLGWVLTCILGRVRRCGPTVWGGLLRCFGLKRA